MVEVLHHPVVSTNLAAMRDKATSSVAFRRHVATIARFLAYEALKDAKMRAVTVETPVDAAQCEVLDEPGLAIVPILRAGMGMLEAVLEVVPAAKVGVVGIKRNEETAEPLPYYENIPCAENASALALVVDPMLATGGSACDAIACVKKKGYGRIKFLCLVAAPQGLEKLQSEHPDVDIYAAAKDERLNSNFYIVPGLGDAGDRIFGTE